MGIIWGLFGDYLGIIWGLYGDYLGIIWGLFGDYLVIIWGLFGDYLAVIWGLFGSYLGMNRDHLRINKDYGIGVKRGLENNMRAATGFVLGLVGL